MQHSIGKTLTKLGLCDIMIYVEKYLIVFQNRLFKESINALRENDGGAVA